MEPAGKVLNVGQKKNTKKKMTPAGRVLYGITKGLPGMNKQTLLGFYTSLEEAKKELSTILKASEKDDISGVVTDDVE